MAALAGGAMGLGHGMLQDPAKMQEQFFTVWFWFQMGLALAVPSLLAFLGSRHAAITDYAGRSYSKLRGETIRNITFTYSNDYWFNATQDDKNNVLQKALTLYIGAHCQQTIGTMKDGEIRLMERQTDESNRGWWDTSSTSTDSDQLKKLTLTRMPPKGDAQELEPGLWFAYSEVPDENGGFGENRMNHHYTFTAYGPKSREKIDAFIQRAYQHYIDILKKEIDTGRYLFQMMVTEGSGGKPPVYKKYRLSEDKTFDSLFFAGKKDMLALIDDFVAGRGKFAIEGFPNKLGLLLHGPPGTGKTSFVKALAQHTNRHIVSVPLAKVNTNQELYDIMFDLVYPTKDDEGISQQFTFRDVIFLMEDIDASAQIVKSRKAETTEAADSEMAKMLKLMAKHEEEQKKKKKSEGSDDAAAEAASGMGPSSDWVSLLDKADKLDLAGLLNILDGVVDSPGRIVIMTTNHPESLDAALIRPGRINTKLHMDYMANADILEMFRHHFPEATAADVPRLQSVLEHKRKVAHEKFNISGAEVEQLCAECETAEEFITELSEYPRLHKDLQAQIKEYN
jgi:chaperone BCS1